MARKEDAEKAVLDPNPTIDGRRANVNLAYMGAKNRTANVPCRSSRAEMETGNELLSFSLADSYSLLARMPTYQSTPTAYPYVFFQMRFFFFFFSSSAGSQLTICFSTQLSWRYQLGFHLPSLLLLSFEFVRRSRSHSHSLSLSSFARLLCLSFDWNEIQVEWKHFLPWGMTMNRSQFEVVKTKVKVE